jgi:ligand-binding sensor domain-containing protein/signal transduction histidine kinase
LTNSNTCLSKAARKQRVAVWLLVAAAGIGLALRGWGLDSNIAVSQYIHDRWGADRGFPGGEIYAIGQSGDGYLWIGTERGLVRFDGTAFHAIDSPAVLSNPIRGLASDGEGNLWIRLDGSRLLRYRDGIFEDAFLHFGQDGFTVTAMASDENGGVLFSGLSDRSLRYHDGKLVTIANAEESPGTVIALTQTRDKQVWFGTNDNGLFSLKDGHLSNAATQLADLKINTLLPAVSGGLWIGTDHGILYWDGTHVKRAALPSWVDQLQVLAMAGDSTGTMWVGTDHGMLRVGPTGDVSSDLVNWSSGHEVTAIFQDREGELWFGGAGGLERLRSGMFIVYSATQGLPAQNGGPVAADSEGGIWFGPRSGGLYRLKDGRVDRITSAGLASDVVYSISAGGGEVWVGRQHGGLTRLTESGGSFAAHTYAKADGLAQDTVYSVLRARDGAIWAGTVSEGVSCLRGGSFTNYSTVQGLPSNTVNSIAEGRDSRIWVATPNGLASFSGTGWSRETLPSSEVDSIFEDHSQILWIATARGLAYLSGGKVTTLNHASGRFREPILGMTEDASGHIWFVTPDEILRVDRDALLNDLPAESEIRRYGVEDGVGQIEGVNRDRSIVVDPAGRIWISLVHGLAVADPRLTANSADPVSVRIDSISASGVSFEPQPGTVKIPPGSQSISFNFAAALLDNPGAVRFRYKLDGLDRDWSETDESRQVTYRNLDPRFYRFRILASNGEGLWNGGESSAAFEIERAFWQTWWFRSCALLAVLLAGFAIYRLRMYQLTRQLNARFQERLAERTHIAQELHDTLLQGFLSASMQVDVAEDQLPEGSPAKPLLKRALQLMGQVTEEGRNAIRGLRVPSRDNDSVEEVFSRMGQELSVDDRMEYRVISQNNPRTLRPAIREEVYRIGREALANAFKHAHAEKVEVEVEYANSHFRLLVRDDGSGIDPSVLRAGRQDHWGLPGMRQRAEKMGATLKLRSRKGAGTEVELDVPSPIAFESQSRPRISNWRRWLGREKPEEQRK